MEKYTYDAFGRPSVTNADGSGGRTWSNGDNPFMLTGRQYFPGLWLYDYRHRWYDAQVGRFLQTDPMGLQTEGAKLSAEQKALFSPGGSAPKAFTISEMNLFRYCGDDPVDRSDPMGSYAEVSVNDRDVHINLPIRYEGPGATPQNVAAFNAAIEKTWSGHIGEYNVTTRVTTPSADTPASKMNRILVPTKGDTAVVSSHSFNTGIWPANQKDGVAHEAGHLMRLYHARLDPESNISGPRNPGLPGREKDIMNVGNKAAPENIQEVIMKNAIMPLTNRNDFPGLFIPR